MTKPSNIATASLAAIEYVAHRMRADEIEQYLAFSGVKEFDPAEFALAQANNGPLRYALFDENGYPAVVAGWYHIYPGVMQCWMAGTEDAWANHWRSITKGCRWLMDELFALGTVQRLQLNALASREEAIRWYQDGLMMKPCGVVERYGARGETVAFFSREVPHGDCE